MAFLFIYFSIAFINDPVSGKFPDLLLFQEQSMFPAINLASLFTYAHFVI